MTQSITRYIHTLECMHMHNAIVCAPLFVCIMIQQRNVHGARCRMFALLLHGRRLPKVKSQDSQTFSKGRESVTRCVFIQQRRECLGVSNKGVYRGQQPKRECGMLPLSKRERCTHSANIPRHHLEREGSVSHDMFIRSNSRNSHQNDVGAHKPG